MLPLALKMVVVNIKCAPGGEKYVAEVDTLEMTVEDFKTKLEDQTQIPAAQIR